jgi:hypothetical protein
VIPPIFVYLQKTSVEKIMVTIPWTRSASWWNQGPSTGGNRFAYAVVAGTHAFGPGLSPLLQLVYQSVTLGRVREQVNIYPV